MRGVWRNPDPAGVGGRLAARAFSLIDLLVSVSVMVILLAIILPAMQMAQESARRVRCASNVRQMAIAVSAYVNDYRDQLPPAYFESQPPQAQFREAARSPSGNQNNSTSIPLPASDEAVDTLFVRYASPLAGSPEPLWDGLGILYQQRYLDHAGIFYCPSHHGNHPYSEYAGEWVNGTGLIAANYQYRVPYRPAFLAELDRRTAIIADGMRTRLDYNHVNGNNFLRADLSVGWYMDLDGSLYRSLPETVEAVSTGPSNHNPWDVFQQVSAH